MKSCIQEVEGKHLRELLTDLMSTPDYFDAKCVRRAVQVCGSDVSNAGVRGTSYSGCF